MVKVRVRPYCFGKVWSTEQRILSGIPESISEDVLEESVIPILADVDVFVERHDIEVCYRFGKLDRDKS